MAICPHPFRSLLIYLELSTARLQTKLAEVDTGETTTKVQGAFENLQVQLPLGAAEGRDAFNARKKDIESAIAQLNAELDAADAAEEREMAAEFDAMVETYATQAAAVEAELSHGSAVRRKGLSVRRLKTGSMKTGARSISRLRKTMRRPTPHRRRRRQAKGLRQATSQNPAAVTRRSRTTTPRPPSPKQT